MKGLGVAAGGNHTPWRGGWPATHPKGCISLKSNIMSLKPISRHNPTASQATKASTTTCSATTFFVEVFFSLFLMGGKIKPKGAFR
jgi:hypothetical protein